MPIIANREYKGSITLQDGQSAVVAGAISRSDQRSLSGIPLLGVPVPDGVNSEVDEDELLMVITPHVLNLAMQNAHN